MSGAVIDSVETSKPSWRVYCQGFNPLMSGAVIDRSTMVVISSSTTDEFQSPDERGSH